MSISRNYKEMQNFILLLFSILTVHLPNCVIVILLYVLNLIFSFFVAASSSFVDLGNDFLNIWKGIMFPSESTLYCTTDVAWLDDVFKFAVMIWYLLLKVMEFMLIEFIFTLSILPSSWCYTCGSVLWNFLLQLFLQTSLKWLIFLHATHVIPYIGHCLGRWLEPQYLHVCLTGVLVCSHGCIPFSLCTLFLWLFCQSFLFCISVLGWLIVPFVPPLF